MADWGIKVSQPGFDVLTCDDEDLVMSSSFNMLKTKIVGASSGSPATIAHGLAYIPIFFTSVRGTGGDAGKGTIIGDDTVTDCDSTNLNVGANTKYYIFYQEGI